jgi:hypothetical protein
MKYGLPLKMSFVRFVLVIFVVFYVIGELSCTRNITINTIDATNTTSAKNAVLIESGSPIEIFFCRKDNCTDILVKSFSNASTIDCAFFSINEPYIVAALEKIPHVRLVVDNTNADDIESTPLGKLTRFDTDRQLSHNKFCIIDNTTMITGSLNPTVTGLRDDANNVVKIASPHLVKNYNEEFHELWDGNFGKGNQVLFPIIQYNDVIIQNYFCPEDKCSAQVLRELGSANVSIDFLLYDLTDTNIAQLLIDKFKSGIRVQGIMEGSRVNMKYSAYKNLVAAGIPISTDGEKGLLHHKVFIIDNTTVITGSYNPTKNADTGNDENLLILSHPDIAQKFLQEYRRALNASQSVKKVTKKK